MSNRRRVVVTGLGLVAPVGNTVDAAWESILAGDSGIRPITHFDNAAFSVRFGGAIRDFDVTEYLVAKEARKLLQDEEAAKLVNDEDLKLRALELVEQHGIVFLDELDKVAKRSEYGGPDVSREGVQRDLLPLVEGSTVSTKPPVRRTMGTHPYRIAIIWLMPQGSNRDGIKKASAPA